MKWYKRKPTKRDKQIANELAKSLGINRVYFVKRDLGHRAYCNYIAKTDWASITMDIKRFDDRRDMYSTLMHEVAHSVCFRERIYPLYHSRSIIKKLSKKQKIYLRRSALRAELYVDRMGERLLRKFFPEFSYRRGYRSQGDRDFLKAYYKKT